VALGTNMYLSTSMGERPVSVEVPVSACTSRQPSHSRFDVWGLLVRNRLVVVVAL